MIVDGTNIKNNDIVRFRLINSYDPGYKIGTVVGIVSYAIASPYGDLISYHAEVLKDHEGLPTDVTTFEFLLVRLPNNEIRAYALPWIETASLSLVDANNNITIKIFNVPSQEAATILKILRDANYTCKQI